MTEAFYAATAINGHDAGHAPPSHPLAYTHSQRFGVPIQEDDGQISCFCGFLDDDGNTVACDLCNRWQHTICYYPEYEGRDLPKDLDHYCIDCRPHPVDAHAAKERQRRKRQGQHEVSYPDNGPKRQPSKSHKKKVKEPNGVPYTNGWPLDKARHDRNSASPRDQPPPAKRPKTVHRTSDSATNSTKGHTRRRTGTNAHRRSVSQSPESPIQLYSDEFLRCYRNDQWSTSHANVMDELRVTNALSEWLHYDDEAFLEHLGTTKAEVLNRWDGELDDIPGKVQLIVQEHSDANYESDVSTVPVWKSVTVQDPLAPGAFIGELRGRIGFKDEYKTDTGNRWPALRHPEPFVFFHPRLPIYIDARNEGTELRYVRRSCTPNARLQVLVTNGTDYHFCFMATTQIDPGMEIAVGWDTTDSILRQSADAASQISQDEMAQLSTWVSTVLANFGPCACLLPDGVCSMSRFDRRSGRVGEADENEAQSLKLPKAKKKRTGHHISPLNTHALNSRSGSEARKVEAEDEPTDSRSASGSAGRGSDSRDITPNTHYSGNGSLSAMPELSERERKKLAKEEEMFRRQEEEQSGKQAKKKRHSAGSTATTPGPTSKPPMLTHNSSRYADAGTSKQSGLPPLKPSAGKRGRPPTLKTPVKSSAKPVQRPKPTYAEASTQCDMDAEEAAQRAAVRDAAPKRKYVSLTQRLLKRCAVNNVRTKRAPASMAPGGNPVAVEQTVEAEIPSHDRTRSPMLQPPAQDDPHSIAAKEEASDDVTMEDAPGEEVEEHQPVPQTSELPRPPDSTTNKLPVWSQPTEPPAPPWPPKDSDSSSIVEEAPSRSHKAPSMHLEMPPPPINPFAAATQPTPSLGIPAANNITTSALAQSPASLSTPLFSPAVTAAVQPSPLKKKMSLSDYTKRKAKDSVTHPGERERGSKGSDDRGSSPDAHAGPVIPSLLHSSSSQVGGGQAIEDGDARMEDAPVHGHGHS